MIDYKTSRDRATYPRFKQSYAMLLPVFFLVLALGQAKRREELSSEVCVLGRPMKLEYRI